MYNLTNASDFFGATSNDSISLAMPGLSLGSAKFVSFCQGYHLLTHSLTHPFTHSLLNKDQMLSGRA